MKYKFSIITPFYNRAYYLTDVIECLQRQKGFADFEDIQIILIDDGSTDKSVDICYKYANEYPNNFLILKQKNGGAASARNKGLSHAKGKYILFLDSDDLISDDALFELYNYFEDNNSKIDVVTYPIYRHIDGEIKEHVRTSFYFPSRIENLKSSEFYQPSINICFKNKYKDIVKFDTKLPHANDSFFNMSILKEANWKIGICDKARYIYRLDKSKDCITNEYKSVVKSFDLLFNILFKKIIKNFAIKGKLPVFCQNIILHYLNFRLKGNRLVPYHKDYDVYLEAIKEVLQYIDYDTIMSFMLMHPFHRMYFVKLKSPSLMVNTSQESFTISDNKTEIFSEEYMKVRIEDFILRDDNIILKGVFFNLFPNNIVPRFFYYINDKKHQIETNLAAARYFRSSEEIGNFRFFEVHIPLENLNNESLIKFSFELNNYEYPTKLLYTNVRTYQRSSFNRMKSYEQEGNTVYFKEDFIHIYMDNYFLALKNRFRKCLTLLKHKPKYLPYYLLSNTKKNKVWLYADKFGKLDNSYLQFLNDYSKDDGIERYYIIHKKDINLVSNDLEYIKEKLIIFGSHKHRYLFLNCSKMIHSFNTYRYFCPFKFEVGKNYMYGVDTQEYIYVQHGVLHAKAPNIYANGSRRVDKLVVSTKHEKEEFINFYNYKEQKLILSGQPRFSKLVKKDTQKKILFAPSYRNTLVGGFKDDKYQPLDKVFSKSTYFKVYNEFLKSDSLNEILEKNDYCLDFALHPNFLCYKDLFEVNNDRIKILDKIDNETSYCLLVTDFSSIIYDYIYLDIPIMFFIPDYDQWRCFNHLYNDLHIDIDGFFGPLLKDSQSVIIEIEELIKNNMKNPTKYQKNYDECFLKHELQTEKLYNALMEEN